MKNLLDYIIKLEMALVGLGAILCYGRYNFYKGRISKGKEMNEQINKVVVTIKEKTN